MTGDPEELGRRVARRFVMRGARPDVRQLAEQMGIEIAQRETPPPAQSRLRSEYRCQPPHIVLYRDPIDSLAAAVHANQRLDMLACDLEAVHIAHEIFNHLEFGPRFGPLRPDEVEAAAHALAQELLGLTFDPRELSAMADGG